MKAKRFDIVVLGSINTDYVVRGGRLPEPGQTVLGDSFYTGAGGKGANQAVTAARLGGRVALIGRVGNESRGRELVQSLAGEGVDIKHICFDTKTASGAAIIAVGRDGEKQISAAGGANLKVSLKQVRQAEGLIASARVLLMQFEIPIQSVVAAAKLARKHGIKVVLDPAPPLKIPRELFALVDVIRPNSDEAEKITGVKVRNQHSARKAARALLKRGVRIVAIQAGADGDMVITAEQEICLPRLKVKTVDATGAGDAFAGAFALALAEELPLEEAARLANATAALSTTKVGAQEGLPTRREVELFMHKKNVAKDT